MMTSRPQGMGVSITDGVVMPGSSIGEAMRAEGEGLADHRAPTTRSAVKDLVGHIAFRFRRWREDQQTWAALRYLDDRQLKEFGICPRPRDLGRPEFP